MASPSTSSPDAGVPSLVAGGAPVDTTQLDRLVEKTLTAQKSGRFSLAAAYFRRAADKALQLHGDTFVRSFLTQLLACCLLEQSCLEGFTPVEDAALRAEARALVSSCLPLLVRRMDANTMLPGRGTAVELAFFKQYVVTKDAVYSAPPVPTRDLQLAGLSLGYATTVRAADLLLRFLALRRDVEVEAFILRVVDCMLPAARSLANITHGEEISFASTVQEALSGTLSNHDAAFVGLLRTKWSAAAMVQMRRERRLLDASERMGREIEGYRARVRADVAEHGLKSCALPSCDKREASVQQLVQILFRVSLRVVLL